MWTHIGQPTAVVYPELSAYAEPKMEPEIAHIKLGGVGRK